jgi:hypothetical protein
MADSLVLTGVKDIKKHTGTEMLRINPKGGGDSFKLARWWVEGGVSTTYVTATVFQVTVGGNSVMLALDTNSSTNVRIDHDGSFNFAFYGINEVSRGALYTDAFELIEHYVFPKISGGQVMTVTPAGAASRPGTTPPVTIGTLTFSGDTTANDLETKTYTGSISGTAGDVTYTITSDDANDTVAGLDVTFNGTGARILTMTATSLTATDSPVTETLNVTVS